MPSIYLHLQICAGTNERKFKVAYSVPFYGLRVQLADKQQAMNHWMFFPTAYCWITLQSQLELSQQIYASDQRVMVHHCRHFCPRGCETIWSSTPLVCCFFLCGFRITKYECIHSFHAAVVLSFCVLNIVMQCEDEVFISLSWVCFDQRNKDCNLSVTHIHTVIRGCVSRLELKSL